MRLLGSRTTKRNSHFDLTRGLLTGITTRQLTGSTRLKMLPLRSHIIVTVALFSSMALRSRLQLFDLRCQSLSLTASACENSSVHGI